MDAFLVFGKAKHEYRANIYIVGLTDGTKWENGVHFTFDFKPLLGSEYRSFFLCPNVVLISIVRKPIRAKTK